jgi:hypothetical protein
MFRAITFVDDCILPQSDTEGTQGGCTANFMKLTVAKLVLLLSQKKNFIKMIDYGILI